MKEKEIRNRDVHKKYLELVKQDSEKIFNDISTFIPFPCPACVNNKNFPIFEKDNFSYVQCSVCDTIFNNPRPSYADIQKLYKDSESTKFWVENFFTPFIEARREKIFKPRAEYIVSKFSDLEFGKIGDIGAGFGIFLEELKKIWKKSDLIAIEPSDEMAQICAGKGIKVLQTMVEDLDSKKITFELLTSFELVEHLYDPRSFFEKINSLLKPGGYFYFTTLNGLGFDIQVLWEKSRSIAPPHHLNFFNPSSIRILLERTNYEIIEISTPGKLDWDIVESSIINNDVDTERFFKMFYKYGTEGAKKKFQEWLSEFNFSSHLSVIARKK